MRYSVNQLAYIELFLPFRTTLRRRYALGCHVHRRTAGTWKNAIDMQIKDDANPAHKTGQNYTDFTTLAWAYLALGSDHDFKVRLLVQSLPAASLFSLLAEKQQAHDCASCCDRTAITYLSFGLTCDRLAKCAGG